MRPLDIYFKGTGEVSNFKFKQIAASDRAYVYEISDENNNLHYVSFLHKERKQTETVVRGKVIYSIAKVVYPKSDSFGIWAWCFKSREAAIKRFDELNNRVNIGQINK